MASLMSIYYRKSDAPCMGCTNRFVGCHSKCEGFKEWSDKEQSNRIKIVKNLEAKMMFESVKLDRQLKKKRR